MSKNMTQVFYGSILHDIGKIIWRSDGLKINHGQLGADFFDEIFDGKYKDISHCLRYHHAAYMNTSALENDAPAYITYIADNIAAAVDRKSIEDIDKKDRYNSFDNELAIADIFNRFGNRRSSRYIKADVGNFGSLDDLGELMPTKLPVPATQGSYAEAKRYLSYALKLTDLTPEYKESLINILEATTSLAPGSTNTKEEGDISLFDHLKLTAALGCSIAQYLEANGITNYKSELYYNSKKFYAKPAFLMVGFHLSGYEEFINTVTSKGAYRQLRSRSFYTNMLSQWFLDKLLTELELTSANVIFSSGQHGYLIVGNTGENRNFIKAKQKEFNNFLLKHFGVRLHLEIGMQEFSSNEISPDNSSQEYARIFNSINNQLRADAQSKYSAFQIDQLNKAGKKVGRECAVCHTVEDLLPGENKCTLCDKLERFSTDIHKEDFFIINHDPEGLPMDDNNHYLSTVSEAEIKEGIQDGYVYAKNKWYAGQNLARYIWVSDYSSVQNNFEKFADRQQGVKRIGSLMIDVDELYAGFLAGFEFIENGKYTSLGHYATLSRRLSLFFRLYLNHFAQDYDLAIIYSEDDNIFALGSWDDLLYFVHDLQEKFIEWTDDKLTFSAGLGMFPPKTPINIIARQTYQLLKQSKLKGGNKITLFEDKNVMSFDQYEDVVFNKLSTFQKFFASTNEHGKVFAYKLLELIHERETTDKISFARLAYYLTRLENASKNKDLYREFKSQFIEWFNDNSEIDKVELALELYLYQTREEK